jgi:hypothetical protein
VLGSAKLCSFLLRRRVSTSFCSGHTCAGTIPYLFLSLSKTNHQTSCGVEEPGATAPPGPHQALPDPPRRSIGPADPTRSLRDMAPLPATSKLWVKCPHQLSLILDTREAKITLGQKMNGSIKPLPPPNPVPAQRSSPPTVLFSNPLNPPLSIR